MHRGGGGGAAGTQTAHPATSSTAPAHQLLGSANAETTPAGAPAAAADRTQRPDATCEGKNGRLSRALQRSNNPTECHTGGGGGGGRKLVWEIGRLDFTAKSPTPNPGASQELLWRELRLPTFTTQNPGASAKFTTAKFTTAKFTTAKFTTANWTRHPPPPLLYYKTHGGRCAEGIAHSAEVECKTHGNAFSTPLGQRWASLCAVCDSPLPPESRVPPALVLVWRRLGTAHTSGAAVPGCGAAGLCGDGAGGTGALWPAVDLWGCVAVRVRCTALWGLWGVSVHGRRGDLRVLLNNSASPGAAGGSDNFPPRTPPT